MRLSQFRPESIAGEVITDEDALRTLFYRSYATGPQGARYELLREAQHTDEDVKRAKAFLRRNYDVVSIHIIHETK